MSDKQNLFPLKLLVLSLGALLVGGAAVLGAMVLGKNAPVSCATTELDLQGRGPVIAINNQQRYTYIIVRKPDGKLEVVTIDTCRGVELGGLTLALDAPAEQAPAPGAK